MPFSTSGHYTKLLKEWEEVVTYCQVRLLLIPSRNRSRNERWRLGPEPEIMWMSLLGDDDADELRNFVGLKCCWDSLSEWDGDDVLKLKFVLLKGERCCWFCFGDWSSRDVAIRTLLISLRGANDARLFDDYRFINWLFRLTSSNWRQRLSYLVYSQQKQSSFNWRYTQSLTPHKSFTTSAAVDS